MEPCLLSDDVVALMYEGVDCCLEVIVTIKCYRLMSDSRETTTKTEGEKRGQNKQPFIDGSSKLSIFLSNRSVEKRRVLPLMTSYVKLDIVQRKVCHCCTDLYRLLLREQTLFVVRRKNSLEHFFD